MTNGDTFNFLKGAGAPLRSPTLNQVAAALASDLRLAPAHPLLHTVEEVEGQEQLVEQHAWAFRGDGVAVFRPNFPEESLGFNELVQRFNDDDWCKANPDHPISYMRAFADNRGNLVEMLRNRKPLEKLTRGVVGNRSMCLIPMDASPEERAKMLEDWNKG